MKLTFRVLFIILIFFQFSFAGNAGVRRALIIGISNYDKNMGWPMLDCYADVKLLSSTLEKQNFTDINIVTDILNLDDPGNKKITKKDIEDAFHTLLSRTHPGDIVLVHYSGHGQQIFDENDNTGYDASIVPSGGAWWRWYDLKKDDTLNYHGENHIRGKEIGKYLDSLRAKVQSEGQVIFTFDCCCSQGATRGVSRNRGAAIPFEPDGYSKKNASNFQKFDLNNDMNVDKNTSRSLAPYIVIEAALQNQEDNEMSDGNGGYAGSLTYSICKALSTNGLQKEISYRQLFVTISNLMKTAVPNQSPVMEGDLDNVVFGSGVVKQDNYFTIKHDVQNNSIMLNGGTLQGIYKGTRISLFPPGTSGIADSNSVEHSNGIVDSASTFNSILTLDKPLTGNIQNNAWAFVTAKSFGDLPHITISLEKIQDANLVYEIRKSLAAYPLAVLNENASDIFIDADSRPDSKGYDLNLKYSSGGAIFNTIAGFISSKDSEKIQDGIRKFAEVKRIINFSLNDPDFEIRVKLLSLPKYLKQVKDFDCTVAEKKYDSIYKNNSPSFDGSDEAIILIKNTGKKRAYYNILDIQPDGIIHCQLPKKSGSNDGWDEPGNCVLEPGKCIIVKHQNNLETVQFGAPYGRELWKVIAGKDTVDLRSLSTQEVTTKGGVAKTKKKIPSSNGSTFDYFFNIVQ